MTCWLIACVVAGGVLLPVTVSTRTIQTCTLCRAERTNRTFLGYAWQSYKDTVFTGWHREHRPTHEHEWARLSCTRGFSIFGTTTYFACGRRHPAGDIPPAMMRQFAEASDAKTLDSFFEGITSTKSETQKAAVQMAWDKILELADREPSYARISGFGGRTRE